MLVSFQPSIFPKNERCPRGSSPRPITEAEFSNLAFDQKHVAFLGKFGRGGVAGYLVVTPKGKRNT